MDIFEAPTMEIKPHRAPQVGKHVETELPNEELALSVNLDQAHRLGVFAIQYDLALHLRTGNMGRALCDLLKLQYPFRGKRVEAAAITMPIKQTNRVAGNNIANVERVT